MELDTNRLNKRIKHCTFCRLHKTRLNAVFGEGKYPSKFMFIAQAPGRLENEMGKLLIGPSGEVFNELLSFVNYKRSNIYCTNLVKCYLPKSRKPRFDEIQTCYHLHLKKEIELVKPEFIITLGYHVTKFAFRLFDLKIPNRFEFKTTFGKLFVAKNRKIIPLRHPATVVHNATSINNLKNEYKILHNIKKECPLIRRCSQYEKYKQGLKSNSFADLYCFGDWKKCNFYLQ